MPKKKKRGQHLQFYMDCMNNDCFMPMEGVSVIKGGLCRAVDTGLLSEQIFKFFSDDQNGLHYWADKDYEEEGHILHPDFSLRQFEFNSLRQTIVLFMAAINNEL